MKCFSTDHMRRLSARRETIKQIVDHPGWSDKKATKMQTIEIRRVSYYLLNISNEILYLDGYANTRKSLTHD